MKGRKPKPTHLKILEGNPGRRRLNENEPKPRPVSPVMPAYLEPEARAEWERVAPALERMGLLTEIDGAALEVYCQSYARYRQAEAQLTRYGTVLKAKDSDYVQQSPYVSISRQAQATVRAFCAEFGLTPSSRSRMTLPGESVEDERERMID